MCFQMCVDLSQFDFFPLFVCECVCVCVFGMMMGDDIMGPRQDSGVPPSCLRSLFDFSPLFAYVYCVCVCLCICVG